MTTLRERDRLERLARVALAGRIAQLRYDQDSYKAYCDDADRQAVGTILERLVSGGEAVFSSQLSLLEAQTQELIDNCWSEVDQCAKLLLERGTLSSRAVRRIVDEV